MKQTIFFSILVLFSLTSAQAQYEFEPKGQGQQVFEPQQQTQYVFEPRGVTHEHVLTPRGGAHGGVVIPQQNQGTLTFEPRTEHLQAPSRYAEPRYSAWEQGVTQPGYGQYPTSYPGQHVQEGRYTAF
jgi:hypothetical protein